MAKAPTIMDVARRAGVSKSTVSLVMGGSPLPAMDTRRKVLSVAKNMGYRPNMIFSMMSSSRKRRTRQGSSIGIAYLSDQQPAKKGGPATLFKMAPEHGFFVDAYQIGNETDGGELVEMLYNRGYAGVIIGVIDPSSSLPYILDLSNFSVVCYSNYFQTEKYHRVRSDVTASLQLAWKKSVEAGYRRIGVACCRHKNPPFPDDRLRLAALLECQYDIPKSQRIPPFLGSPGDTSAYMEWLKENKPDSVIGFQSHHYYCLLDLGVRVPEEMGFSSLVQAEGDTPAFMSGIEDSNTQVCFNVLSLMNQLIRNRIRGMPEYPTAVLVESNWHEGKTLKQSEPLCKSRLKE